MAANISDPKEWLDSVDAQWNAGNLDGAIAFFTDDAVARFIPPLPGAPDPVVGREQLRSILQALLPGFHVKSTQHALDADRVTWKAAASNDTFRKMGIGMVEADGEAVLEGNKMKSFTIRFTPETVARLQAAAQAVA